MQWHDGPTVFQKLLTAKGVNCGCFGPPVSWFASALLLSTDLACRDWALGVGGELGGRARPAYMESYLLRLAFLISCLFPLFFQLGDGRVTVVDFQAHCAKGGGVEAASDSGPFAAGVPASCQRAVVTL